MSEKREHEIERLYMEQLRNLETTINSMSSRRKACFEKAKNLKRPIAVLKDPENPSESDYGQGLVVGTIFWILIWGALFFMGATSGSFIFEFGAVIAFFCTIAGVVLLIFLLCSIFSEKRTDKINYEETLKYNRKVNENNRIQMEKNLVDARWYEERGSLLNESVTEAEKIRADLYAVNWIPSRYRNIRVIYYIHDMVTTSEISIEEALKYYLLQEVNNKLDEVLVKLDRIIENQRDIIMNQAAIQAQNQEIISKNKRMISQLSDIQSNTSLAADYARIGAGYAEANAYFSGATYLALTAKK